MKTQKLMSTMSETSISLLTPIKSGDPIIYTVADIKRIFKCGLKQAYEIVNTKGFPSIKLGKKIIVEKNVTTDNIDEIAETVGIGAVIFNELAHSRLKDYVFSWKEVLNFEGETGPYVQYSHARAASVLRKAGDEAEKIAKGDIKIDAGYLTSDSAYNLSKLIYGMPQAVLDAANKYEPSVITRHVVDIAQAFNRFYQDEYILVDEEKERTAKLALVTAAKTAIKNCLGLLGMKAPERM